MLRTGLTYIVERGANGVLTARKRWYSGAPTDDNGHVSEVLDPRLDLENHSPDGFEAGYAGSGPAQLALAILADALQDDARAVKNHQGYKFCVIANLGGPTGEPFRWETPHLAVIRVVEKIERYGWQQVHEELSRNRSFSPQHAGEKAFSRRK